jgi:hypothetical protein
MSNGLPKQPIVFLIYTVRDLTSRTSQQQHKRSCRPCGSEKLPCSGITCPIAKCNNQYRQIVSYML